MKYSPSQLRMQASRMHPGFHEGGKDGPDYLLNVGLGAGMLIAAAAQLKQMSDLLRVCEGLLVDVNLQHGDEYHGGLGAAINAIRQMLQLEPPS